MAKQIITVRDTVKLQIEAQVELDIKYLKPGEEPESCTPSSSIPQFTALSRSELMDVVAAYLATPEKPVDAKEFSEGYLSDMLTATNGIGRIGVRDLWFDAVQRGNRLVERYESERSLQRESSKELPKSGESQADS